jgi:hypothetical protein
MIDRGSMLPPPTKLVACLVEDRQARAGAEAERKGGSVKVYI